MNLIYLTAVTVIAFASLLGSAAHWPLLSCWIDGTATMKTTTAWMLISQVFAFLLLCSRASRKEIRPAVWFTSGINVLLAAELFREITFKECWAPDPAKTFFPSTMTVVAVLLLACKAMTALHTSCVWIIQLLSLGVSLIGASTIAGYLLNDPPLYFVIPHLSTGVAVPTGLSFFLLGLCRPKIKTDYP
jgi:hypothetical protein